MNPKLRAILGIICWVIGYLTLVVVVRGAVTAGRVGPGLIHDYQVASAFVDAGFMLLFLVAAYFLTRPHLDRTKPRIALAVGLAIAILLGINASYVIMPG